MARAEDVIENPLTGERITFLETTGETGGELLRFEYFLPPGFSVPEHVHVGQEERHEILAGTLRGRVGGYEQAFVEGQKMIGPAGVPHAWRNASDEEGLLMISELRPAQRFEPLLETAFALAGGIEAHKTAVPGRLLRIAVLLDEAREDFYPTRIPMPAWKAALALNAALARVGRLLGYGGDYPAGSRGTRLGFLGAGALAVFAFALLRRAREHRGMFWR